MPVRHRVKRPWIDRRDSFTFFDGHPVVDSNLEFHAKP
jgi:hypothetical protein